jgi:hypothetical protein
MAQMIITHKELDAYYNDGGNCVSDLDNCFNPENGEYDMPSIEWESAYGRYWQSFSTEEARDEALELNRTRMNAWVLDYRKGAKARAEALKQANLAKIRKQHFEYYEYHTLGGAFPELKKLCF